MNSEQFRILAGGLPEAMLLVSPDGRVLAANGAAARLFNVDGDGLEGGHLSQWVHDEADVLGRHLAHWAQDPSVTDVTLWWRLGHSGGTVECLNQGFAAGDQIVLRIIPGRNGRDDHRTLSRQINSQRKHLRQLRQSRQALAMEHTKALVTLNSVSDAVITTDREANVEWLNPTAEALTGWSSEEAVGRPLQDVFNIIDETSGELVVDSIALALEEERVVKLMDKIQLISRDGFEIVIEAQATPLQGSGGEGVLGAVIIFRDVTRSHDDRQQLEYLTQYDLLTGLFNRQHFEQQLDQAVHRARRSQLSHAMLHINLRGFKQVNDAWGHAAGDELLIAAARLFGRRLRGGDILARLGADEFGVLLHDVNRDQALRAAQSFREALEGYRFRIDGGEHPVAASIGVAMVEPDTGTGADVARRANLSCEAAKRDPDNPCRMAPNGTCDDHPMALHEVRMLGLIKQALGREGFVLNFQPVVAAADGRVRCYEALLRLHDSDGALLMPGDILPVAERHGLMTRVDRWVLKQAVAELKQTQGQERAPCLTVNLAYASIAHPDTVAVIDHLLMAAGVEPARLMLELAEADVMAHVEKADSFIRQAKGLGCRVVLDEFGAGFSSFVYLRRLPVDFLKINGGFVGDVASDPVAQATVAGLVGIARSLGRKTIASYIENEATRRQLDALGVDLVQGFGVGRPLGRLAEAA